MKAAIAIVAVLAGHASADDGHDGPDLSYLYDGGAVPLFWVPLAGGFVIDREVSPRSTPLLFSAHEGGATPSSWEVPAWTLTATGAAAIAVIGFAGSDPSRWYHAKGLAEAMATSSFVVSVTKPLFGRHRPDWSPTTTDPIELESFPSGHASNAFVIATYSALYLHGHVWAGEPMAATHVLAYTGILAGALLVDGERVYHHRHFVSDVVAGSLLGAATSALIYRFQDARASGQRTHDWAIAPSLDARASTFSVMGTF